MQECLFELGLFLLCHDCQQRTELRQAFHQQLYNIGKVASFFDGPSRLLLNYSHNYFLDVAVFPPELHLPSKILQNPKETSVLYAQIQRGKTEHPCNLHRAESLIRCSQSVRLLQEI